MGDQDVDKIPQSVIKEIQYLQKNKIWHQVSKNRIGVVRCSEAAPNRIRMNRIGIPLFDELKSEVGFIINNEKTRQDVIVHCRGNQRIDRIKVSQILNSEYKRSETYHESKGLINPFGPNFNTCFQLFDETTVRSFLPPFTMMTNAGHYQYGVELSVPEIVSSLGNVLVADVTADNNCGKYREQVIGIITGGDSDAGLLLWQKINQAINKEARAHTSEQFPPPLPTILIESIPHLSISQDFENRAITIKNLVIKALIDMCKRGANVICFTNNWAPLLECEIESTCKMYGARYVNSAAILKTFITEDDYEPFDVISSNKATLVGKKGPYSFLETPSDILSLNDDFETQLKAILLETSTAIVKHHQLQNLRNFIKEQCHHNTIIVLESEVSSMLSKHPKISQSKKIVDILDVIASHIAKEFWENIRGTIFFNQSKKFSIEELDELTLQHYETQIWKILLEINNEFIPPLSYRDSTTITFDNSGRKHAVPQKYFVKIKEQNIVVCRNLESDAILGFISFIYNYTLPVQGEYTPVCYITTIGVTRGARGRGIAIELYKFVEELARSNQSTGVATRTWSTNISHINILSRRGYREIECLENDRGSGIDTLYFKLPNHTDNGKIEGS